MTPRNLSRRSHQNLLRLGLIHQSFYLASILWLFKTDSGPITECNAGACRVRASLVCRAWLRAEAANPVQHTHLRLSLGPYVWIPAEKQKSVSVKTVDTKSSYSKTKSRIRWELRDTTRLQGLYLCGYNVPIFLAIKPTLTRLGSLTLERFGYSDEHAQQLRYLSSLKTLQVRGFCACLASLPVIVSSVPVWSLVKQDSLLAAA